ncbi:hypothetical protein HDU83_005043 [Entophlyctis luteolus]|nr:hypothetical protein HDU83_005043 [Entophlyctis luteolus]
MICFGPEYSYGIFTSFYLNQGLGSASVVSLIGSVGAACVNLFGILSTTMMNNYGYQRVMLIGAVLYLVGFLLASFSLGLLPVLFLTQAAMYGIGASFAYYPALSAPNQWFEKKRGIATGVGVAGSGVGGVLYSIGTQQLLDRVGFEWTMRITAVFSFVCICAVIPLVKQRIKLTKTESRIDFTVFKQPLFNATLLCIVFFCIAFYIPTYYLPDFAVNVLNVDTVSASYLLTAHNGFAILGRLLIGVIADLILGRVNSLILVVFVHSISTLIWYFSSSLPVLYAFTFVNGFMSGAFWVVFPVVVAEFFGVEKLGGLVGILYTANAVGAIVGPAVAGAFRDHVGYGAMVLFCGALTLLSTVFAVTARVLFKPDLLRRV